MNINKVTSNTWNLLSQEKGLAAKSVRICKQFRSLKKEITSVDITKIKKGNITKDIQFIKFANNTLGTVIKEFKGRRLVSTAITFSQKKYYGKDVQKYVKNNAKNVTIKENTLTNKNYSFFDDDYTDYSRLKTTVEFNKKGLKEVQQFNLYRQNEPTKELKLDLSLSKQGEIKDINTTSKNINDASLKILKDNHYVATCTFNNENFVCAEHFEAEKNQNVADKNVLFTFKKNLGTVLGRSIDGCASGKSVMVKVNECADQLDLVDTLNHEYRHVYQNKMMKNFKNIFKRGKMSPEEQEFAKKCIAGNKKYSTKAFQDYYDNFVEVDARNAGEKASKEYARTILALNREFNIGNSFLSHFKKI